MKQTPNIRYAIWAAVSTEMQAAEDKFSLQTQVDKSRVHANAQGWVETASPYIVPGESRTKYINLSDAERQIPPLRQMLDDAQNGKFDVLVCMEYDRFRELLDPVARTLAHYGVQLYSVSQPIPPQEPSQYSPYNSDSEYMLRGLNQMISRSAIANLRRKYASEMPKRVLEKGLNPAALPWGYRKPPGQETNADAIPELIPEIANHLRWMKDWLLSGKSTYQIVAELNRLQVPIPKPRLRRTKRDRTEWDATTVRRILSNPYYAGLVRWGVTKTRHDLRTGQVKRDVQPSEQIQVAQGRHESVWDVETWNAIIAELDRRAPSHRGHITRHFTGLLRCSVCQSNLWRHTRTIGTKTKKENQRMSWRCSQSWKTHMSHFDFELRPRIAEALTQLINSQATDPEPVINLAELEDLKTRRARIADAYEHGLFDRDEFGKRVQHIDAEIRKIQTAQQNAEQQKNARAMRDQVIAALQTLAATVGLDNWLQNGDPLEVNTALHHLVNYIVIDENGEVVEISPK